MRITEAFSNGRTSTGADGDGSQHFKYGAEDHGLLVGDGSGRNAGRPGVGDIVCGNKSAILGKPQAARALTCAVVVGVEQGKESADDENVGVLVQRHFDRRVLPAGRSV